MRGALWAHPRMRCGLCRRPAALRLAMRSRSRCAGGCARPSDCTLLRSGRRPRQPRCSSSLPLAQAKAPSCPAGTRTGAKSGSVIQKLGPGMACADMKLLRLKDVRHSCSTCSRALLSAPMVPLGSLDVSIPCEDGGAALALDIRVERRVHAGLWLWLVADKQAALHGQPEVTEYAVSVHVSKRAQS